MSETKEAKDGSEAKAEVKKIPKGFAKDGPLRASVSFVDLDESLSPFPMIQPNAKAFAGWNAKMPEKCSLTALADPKNLGPTLAVYYGGTGQDGWPAKTAKAEDWVSVANNLAFPVALRLAHGISYFQGLAAEAALELVDQGN